MSWYRRTKHFLVSSRRNIINPPRISPESPSSNAFSRIHRNRSSNPSAKFSGFSRSGLSLRNSLGNTNINICKRFLSIPKKFDRHQVPRFKPPDLRRWSQNPAAVLAAVLVVSGVLVTLYCNLETVPYTKRRRFVLWPKLIEKWVAEYELKLMKSVYEGKKLPADHPDSIRVKSIVKDIIEGMQRSLGLESVRYASTENDGSVKDTTMALSGMKWSEQEEIEDDIWIQQSRKNGKDEGSQPTISHLEGLNWEVLVIEGSYAGAFCLSSGTIVVATGLLERLKTDAEIVTVIGNKIGSVVARHKAEEYSTFFCLFLPLMVPCQFFPKPFQLVAETMMFLLLFYATFLREGRENAAETDRIGLILLAEAGYDPRVAPGVYEKLGKLKSARRLVQSKAMEEALSIYRRQVRSGFGR
ncbi:PREDICTED: uncharacterized protein LOC104825079 [Tarenaya hassleriana]|uniref:uncharacterized protein LOC104825079 n=1 Tax=Tarenaya hassleriana TaxID=28532 RepID=UPI00053C6F95|nr:PREDICTED: uncharacterized protein LOC104825079 [Tarenaya hassleriana]